MCGFVALNMKVEIKRVSDGTMSCAIWENWKWYTDETKDYWWSEGNASCDCNRGQWFNDAMDIDEDYDECGEGAYLVRLSNADTGELLYTDMDSLA